MESVYVEIIRPDQSNIIIGNIYRPPNSNIQLFNDKMNEIMTKITNEQKDCYLMGDFNIDLLKYQQHNDTNNFLDTMFSHSFLPAINRPTRITSHTATSIDNIFSNCLMQNNQSDNGILFTDISDHLPIFFLAQQQHKVDKVPIKLSKRMINAQTKKQFSLDLNNCNWDTVLNCHDPNTAYDKFVSTYNHIYETCFPLKTLTRKKGKLATKPWITKGFVASIKNKSKLYKEFLRNPTPDNEYKYKKFKNKLNYLLKMSKRNYYDSKFESAKGNLRSTWKLLNQVINRKSKTKILPTTFIHNGNEIRDPLAIANKFCEFFTNVGPSYAKKLPPSNISPHFYLGNKIRDSIFLSPVTENEIKNLSSELKSGKSTGFDNISVSDVKSNIEYLAKPLTYIINLSISTGTVPSNIKLARVIPIHKNDSYSDFNNYRPISILPVFSKFYEKVIYNRFVSFINKHNMLYEHQYGFRSNYSTSMAVIQLVNQISSSIDNKEFSLGIFLDLSKAFDTVNHKILLGKLEFYGIRGTALNWITSYLNNRKQFVEFNNVKSSYQTVKCGIPQGSILGPLLFIMYINDISNSSNLLNFILFADDTNIFYSSKDLSNAKNTLHHELEKVIDWLIANQLSLNLKKTNYIIFKPRQKKLNYHDFSLKVKNSTIERKSNTKFLGVIIDEHLSWKEHINTVAGKISKSIGIISKSRFFVSRKSLFMLYYALVYPYLFYGNIIWCSTYQTNLNRLKILQKRVVRIITNSKYDAHTTPLFSEYHILKLDNIHSFQLGIFMFSIENRILPNTFLSMFTKNSNFHSYPTRHCNDYRPEFCRTNIKQFTVASQGPKLWNSLPLQIRSAPTLSNFKSKLKKYISSQL